jgi:hypothetical protein
MGQYLNVSFLTLLGYYNGFTIVKHGARSMLNYGETIISTKARLSPIVQVFVICELRL